MSSLVSHTKKQIERAVYLKYINAWEKFPVSSAGFLPEKNRGTSTELPIPAKRDASILVGGCESSAGRRLMQYVPVRWSQKHCDCSLLPLSEQHKRGIMLTSTSWYHGAPHPPRDFICCCCWNQDMELKSKRKPVDVVLGCFIAVCLYNLCLAQRSEWSFVFCEGRWCGAGWGPVDDNLWTECVWGQFFILEEEIVTLFVSSQTHT